MLDLFTTREIAATIYIIPFILIVVLNKKIRNSAYKVIKVACSHQLIIPFIILLLYATIIVFGMTHFSFWKWIYLKDTIIWVLFVGVPVCFNATNRRIENHYFRNMVISNLKFSVLVEFFLNTFTFSLVTELILQAILIFLTLLQAISETKDKYHDVKKMLDAVLAIVGIVLLFKTVQNAIESYQEYDVEGWIISLLIPLIFSVLYIPAAHLLAVYSRYRLLFIRMRFKEDENWKIIAKHRAITFCLCRLSIKNIEEFEEMCIRRMYKKMDKEEFNKLIYDYRKRKKMESCV